MLDRCRYIGGNESDKPWAAIIQAGCNSWRNWEDIDCGWQSLTQIIEHWGEWGRFLATVAGPGHFNDPDMLLIGNGCLTVDEEKTQMALWSISAAPLIMVLHSESLYSFVSPYSLSLSSNTLAYPPFTYV